MPIPAHWTPQETLALLKGNPSRRGGRPDYSSANYLLLGMLIEQVRGRPLAEVLRADLLGPVGLDRVAVQDSERPTPPLAAPPRRLRDGRRCTDLGTVGLSAIRCAAVIRRHGARDGDTQSADDIFFGTGYALGTMVFHNLQFAIADSVGHSGGTPGYASLVAVAPERHLSVALLIPEEAKDLESIMKKLFAALR